MKSISLKPAGAAINLRRVVEGLYSDTTRALVTNLPAIAIIGAMVSFFTLIFGAATLGFITGVISLLAIGADLERTPAQKGGAR